MTRLLLVTVLALLCAGWSWDGAQASPPRFDHPTRWYVPAPAYVKANRSAAKCLTRLGADFVQRYDFSAELEAWWPNDEKYLYVEWIARAGQISGAVYFALGDFNYAKIDGCLNRAMAASAPANVKPDRRGP